MKNYVKHGGTSCHTKVAQSCVWSPKSARMKQMSASARRADKARKRELENKHVSKCSHSKWVDAHKTPSPDREAVYVPKGVDNLTFLRSHARG